MDIVTYALLKKYIQNSIASGEISAGKSAYQIAVENGFVGTEQEWLDSLKGEGATVEIGDNGNWIINGVDSGVKAEADDMSRIEDAQIRDLFNCDSGVGGGPCCDCDDVDSIESTTIEGLFNKGGNSNG